MVVMATAPPAAMATTTPAMIAVVRKRRRRPAPGAGGLGVMSWVDMVCLLVECDGESALADGRGRLSGSGLRLRRRGPGGSSARLGASSRRARGADGAHGRRVCVGVDAGWGEHARVRL